MYPLFCSICCFPVISLVHAFYATCMVLSLPIKFFFPCFLKYLRRNLGTSSPFPSKAKKQAAVFEVTPCKPLLLITVTTNLLDLNFCSPSSCVSCCESWSFRACSELLFSFFADASVLLPIWSVPYLNNSAVQTHCLSSVQCTAESTDPTDCTASRYLHLLLISSAAHSALAGETCWLCFHFEFEQQRRKLVAVLFENTGKITT